MEQGFEKADSRNLPIVNSAMIHEFYSSNPAFTSAEVKNVKAQRASRVEYGDDAIGYVQVKRSGDVCIIKAKITPEHKVRHKPYSVTATINEKLEIISSVECHDCVASSGGCKHNIAIIFWLYRRSMEPSVTSVECYWKVSNLSKVGKTIKSKTLLEMFGGKSIPDGDDDFLNEVIEEGIKNKSNSIFCKHFKNDDVIKRVSIHGNIVNYLKTNLNRSPDDFINFLKNNLNENDLRDITNMTTDQSKSPAWHEMRYCRITASKLYETARCKTDDGALVEKMFGGTKGIETPEMIRGIKLEHQVLAETRKQYNFEIKTRGLIINKDWPLFGASPDGLSDRYVIEVKCPSKAKTVKNFIISSSSTMKYGNIAPKVYAQIQLQMFLAKRKYGILCVASTEFEENRTVSFIELVYDEQYCLNIMNSSSEFWTKSIFPKLLF